MFPERLSEIGELIPANKFIFQPEESISGAGPDDGIREIEMENLLFGDDNDKGKEVINKGETK
ncbi:MAG: hypothetical protein KatS3mg088_009 [Patescibacteria group bacterium]|nr:MAG: hypothetical protein KatS3mg088_009 [Patescibacteria group bacterium]